MDFSKPVHIATLERQLREGPGRLKFLPELEPQFLAQRADAIVTRRLALIVASLVLIGTTPILNALVLHPPAAFTRAALGVQFGLMIPSLLVAALFTMNRRLRRWQDPVAAFTAVAVTAGILVQRHVGAALGFAIPVELVSVVLLGTAVLGGLRLLYFGPAVVAILVGFGYNEIVTFGATAAELNTIVAMGMMGVLAGIGSFMEERSSRAEWLHRRLAEEMSVQDSLSGLPNARAFREAYPRLHATAARDGKPMLVAVLDIDYFKNYNDHYGHRAGDECLKRVAQVLPNHARRATDLQARIGGEEFVLVWYDVGPARGAVLLEAVREQVEELGLEHAARPAGPPIVTLSLGGACIEPGESAAALLEAADRQLYEAKQRGRNRVSVRK